MLPMLHPWRGWWAKMNLFSPDLERFRPFLYLDLDTAVSGDIQALQPKEDIESHFIMLKDFYRPKKPASGFMWVPNNSTKINLVWSVWKTDPQSHIKKYRGDQDFISAVVTPDSFWQDITKGIYTFKPTQRRWLDELPMDASIICFHGKPRIWDAAKHVQWVKKYIYGE